MAPTTVASDADPAAQAFARLAEKVDLLEAAIAGLAARRDTAPDYSETLGEIASLLEKMRTAINTLARRPAMEITPDAMAERITAAGAKARVEDSATIKQAHERIDRAASRMEYLAGTVATIREHRRHLIGAAGIGSLVGMMLWSFLPGGIARATPETWHWPERMAARTLDLEQWMAGERLLATAEPERWRTVILANMILQENRDTIARCRDRAAKAKKSVKCAVEIKPAQ
jgi:hypothetical protein